MGVVRVRIQSNVDRWEHRVEGHTRSVGDGLCVRINKGPNQWRRYVNATDGSTTMGLGWTKRVSFHNAETIGERFAEFAKSHTQAECGATAELFRKDAKTEAGKGRVPRQRLLTVWNNVSASGDREGASSSEHVQGGSTRPRGGGGSGEGQKHKDLKRLVARQPSLLGLSDVLWRKVEFKLPSGDDVDVLFVLRTGEVVVVEVKAETSERNIDDVRRGLFQCVKYQAVAKAMLKDKDSLNVCRKTNEAPSKVLTVKKRKAACVRALLCLGFSLPQRLEVTREKLGLNVKSVGVRG